MRLHPIYLNTEGDSLTHGQAVGLAICFAVLMMAAGFVASELIMRHSWSVAEQRLIPEATKLAFNLACSLTGIGTSAALLLQRS